MGGGILPYTIHEGDIYFLLSRESVDYKWKESGLWSDFGGNEEETDEGEKSLTASREFYEETMGCICDFVTTRMPNR